MQRLTYWMVVAGLAIGATVQAGNPELTGRVQGIDDAEAARPLHLAELDLDVDVGGALADVTLTAKFLNPTNDILEGQFAFQLPDGAVVTGFALDIDGLLVDGVLVEPLKAERAYEEQVREKIDPGVASVSRANLFTTRVYPIPDEDSRTIRLMFSAPVHAVHGLVFPLETNSPVGSFRVKVRASGLREPARVTLPGKVRIEPGTDGEPAQASLRERPLSGEFRLAPVVPAGKALLSRHPNGEERVHIVDVGAASKATARTGPRLRVYWDRSLSRRDHELAKERALLARYLEESRPSAIDLVLFNSSGAHLHRVTPGELDSKLRGALYRGATSFAVLKDVAVPEADVCLFFTDGVVTIDSRRHLPAGCAAFAVTSATDPDTGFLRRLVGVDAAAVLNLRTQDERSILARLAGAEPRVLQARATSGRELRFSALHTRDAGWSVITESVRGPIVLRIAGADGSVFEREYSPTPLRETPFNAGAALWAADAASLLAAEDGSRKEFVALSRRFSIAGPGLSFLVLEDAWDYVNADVEPPANYPAERLARYRQIKAERDEDRREEELHRLADVVQRWSEVVSWWHTDFDALARQRAREAKRMARGPVPVAPASAAPAPAPAASSITAEDIGRFPELEQVVVTGMQRQATVPVDNRDIRVELAEWDVEKPYILALDAAAARDIDRVLGAQEREYGAMPAFYFDVAEWFHRKGRVVEALELLLSALELPLADEQTASLVADRLLRFGRHDRAVWLLERAAEQTDYLPQPRRTLALALSKRAERNPELARADLQRAMQLLGEVIMTPWQGEFDGIEVIALMEANAIRSRLAALGVDDQTLDPSLRALLDVDLRVVIEWNTAATDMDLWVDEPGGERAIYSNPRTAIGGRLSNDMTEGFGPEEYLLRRSKPGEYRISVNVYAADSINPNGSTVVTARLFRDFGRPTQREETMEIELSPDEEGEKLIGRFTVQ